MRAIPTLLLSVTLAAPVAAQTGPSAADVQSQLRAALGPFGGDQAPPEKQVGVTQEGDHYRLSMPFLTAMGLSSKADTDIATTATARLVDGQWVIEDIKSPSPVEVTIDQPGGGPPMHMKITRGDQNGQALFDPTLKRPSSLSMIVRNIATDMTGAGLKQSQKIESYTLQGAANPHGDGLLDITQTLDATNWAIAMQAKESGPVEVAINHGHIAGGLTQVDTSRIAPLMAAAYKLSQDMVAGASAAKDGKPPSIDPTALRNLASLMSGLAQGGQLDESADDVRVVASGKRGSVDHAGLGMGANAHDGALDAFLSIAVDGLALPDTPEAQPYLPKHLALRPTISGIDLQQLSTIARQAQDPNVDQETLGMEALGLLTSGKLKVGIDTFALDMGDAKFRGTGTVAILAPTPAGLDGTARVTAENFDAFMKQMQAQAAHEPKLAQALPALVFAKGLAQADGKTLVWNIAYKGGQLTVNGVNPMPAQPGAAPGGPPGGKPKH